MPALPSVRPLARSVLRRAVAVHRQVTEAQLAQARLAERQVHAWFELHRTFLAAAQRFVEAAVPAEAQA